jgi:hypothetical protein
MPEGLTQTKTLTFSETWLEIDRNGGRLHFGMVAGFTSEYPAGINRNPHARTINEGSGKLKRDQCIHLRAPTGYGNIRWLVEIGLKAKR